MECGISIKDYNSQVNDIIECYEIQSTPRKLEEKQSLALMKILNNRTRRVGENVRRLV